MADAKWREGRATSNSRREGRAGKRTSPSWFSPRRALREAKRLSDRPAPSRDLGWPAAPSTSRSPRFGLFFFSEFARANICDVIHGFGRMIFFMRFFDHQTKHIEVFHQKLKYYRFHSPSQDTAACIRDCVESIIANRPLACGLVCHLAPYVQSERVPYGHGDLVGTTFEHRTGSKAQVYLVAPAGRFVKRDHGPLTVYDETQLRAYYRSIPDMQNPTQVFGRIPLDCRLRPLPASPSPPCGTPPSTMGMTPGRDYTAGRLPSGRYLVSTALLSDLACHLLPPCRQSYKGRGTHGPMHLESRARWLPSR